LVDLDLDLVSLSPYLLLTLEVRRILKLKLRLKLKRGLLAIAIVARRIGRVRIVTEGEGLLPVQVLMR